MRWSPVDALRGWFGRLRGSGPARSDAAAVDDDTEDPPSNADQGFLRSRLDASVLFAHGTRSRPADSSIDEVQEQGEELDAAATDHEHREH